jgi:SRSO17 transposase
VAGFFMEFCESFSGHFISQGMNSVEHARHYLSGLLGKQRRKNIETIENDIPGSDYQGLEQFISSSPWSHEAVMEQVAAEADKAFGDPEQTGLNIDESSFLKKGRASVGVQRQWSGRAGKVENCQVGVFACIGNGTKFAITDFRLYLPEEWASDPARCRKAKVPQEHCVYRPKWKQALEMVANARARGQRFGFVGCDSLYGSNALFVNALEDAGEYFMGDVDKSKQVWLEEPLVESPGKEEASRGRPLKHPRIASGNIAEKITVGKLVEGLDEEDFEQIAFRQGEKGRVCGRFWMGEVWHWHKEETKARKRILVVRKDVDGSLKYSLTNLPGGKPLACYAKIQGQRFWIEHAFHEAKSQLGMAQYQVRMWKGWHHHMALICMALLFTEIYKAEVAEETPLLSARDITELLAYYLPRRDRTEAEVHEQIRKRHEKRKADRDRRKHHKTGIPRSLTK